MGALRAGKLDRRIVIRRPGPVVDDGFGSQPGALADYATRWASWQPARGREVFENMGREAKAGGTFWLRYDNTTAGIRTTDVVRFQDRDWDIVSIQEVGRREGVELIVVASDEETT